MDGMNQLYGHSARFDHAHVLVDVNYERYLICCHSGVQIESAYDVVD